MSTESPLKVSITGIDGSGKSTVASLLTPDIGSKHDLIKLSRPVYSVIEGEEKSHFQGLIRSIDRLHNLADQSENKGLILTANAINVVLQGRVIEPILTKRLRPELVVGTRDQLIDPSVYAIFYSPRIGQLPIDERIDLFQKISGATIRDVIFFLTVPPDEAVKRIESRIDAESQGRYSKRKKWRHLHENVEDLGRIQHEYYSALDEIAARSPAHIIEIDTTMYPQEEVAHMIGDTLSGFLREPQVLEPRYQEEKTA